MYLYFVTLMYFEPFCDFCFNECDRPITQMLENLNRNLLRIVGMLTCFKHTCIHSSHA